MRSKASGTLKKKKIIGDFVQHTVNDSVFNIVYVNIFKSRWWPARKQMILWPSHTFHRAITIMKYSRESVIVKL